MQAVKGGQKDTRAAEHHYFPRSLQKFWRDDEGWVHRIRPSGKRDKSRNGTFGHVRNAHHIKLADKPTVWDESFEYLFGPADASIPKIVALLSQVEAPAWGESEEMRSRIAPQWHLEQSRRQIAEVLTSLVVRSPNIRNLIRITVEGFWETPPWQGGSAPTSLISANQKPLLERYSNALASRGKFAILLSDQREFVFGDGMLHNFHSGGAISPYNPRCVLALTPTVAVAYDCPSSYHVSANFVGIRLTPREVDEVNFYTQVYSANHLYFRSQPPEILDAFNEGKHQQLEYHRAAWLDELMHVVANTWF